MLSVLINFFQEINQPAVYITSRNGQEFQCVLPQLNEEEISEKEVVNDKDTDVLELLKPMKSGSCLSKVLLFLCVCCLKFLVLRFFQSNWKKRARDC